MTADLKTEAKRRQYEQARLLGGQARRSGKRIGDCPYRGHTALVRDLSQEWQEGWRDADMAIKGVK